MTLSPRALAFVEVFEGKIAQAFNGIPEHVSASVGDVKRAAILVVTHLVAHDDAEDAESPATADAKPTLTVVKPANDTAPPDPEKVG